MDSSATTRFPFNSRIKAAVAAVVAASAVGLGLFVTDDPRSGFEALSPQASSSGTSSFGSGSAAPATAEQQQQQQRQRAGGG